MQFSNYKSMKKGFSLLEILVVIGLMVLLMGAGVASFQASNQRQKLVQAKERVRQILLQARSNAQSGKKDCQACGAPGPSYTCGQLNPGTGLAYDAPLFGWRLMFTGGSPMGYRMDGFCPPASGFPPDSTSNVFSTKSELLPAGITVTTNATSAPAYIFFKVGGQGVLTNGAGNNLTITLSDGGVNPNQVITVDGSGRVN